MKATERPMTTTAGSSPDVSTLPAGRELDAEIAEKVMGWSGRVLVRKYKNDSVGNPWYIAFRHADDSSWGDFARYFTESGEKLYCRKPWAPHFPPLYSSSISAAWQVVEKWRADRYAVEIIVETDKAEAIISSVQHDWHGWADTIPLAVCRAALAAVQGGGDRR